MINAAIVGLGWWGRHIVSTLQGSSDKIRVIRGIDLAAEGLQKFAAECDLVVTAEIGDALSDPDVHAVLLATPHSLHEQQIIAAAAAGKHVFCEKPLALNRSSAERAISACNIAGVVLGVGHERRFEPAMIEIKRMIDDGELGTVLHAESNFSHDVLKDVADDNWRATESESPAAAMTATGIHLTDAYLNMLGPITEVFGQTSRLVMTAGGGDVTSVQFRFESGATAYFSSVLATPLYIRYQVFGSDAWVEARDTSHPQEQTITYLTICRAGGQPKTVEIQPVDSVKANLEAFARAALGEAPYPFTDQQKIDNIATLEAIVKSVAAGQPQSVQR